MELTFEKALCSSRNKIKVTKKDFGLASPEIAIASKDRKEKTDVIETLGWRYVFWMSHCFKMKRRITLKLRTRCWW